MSRPRKTTDGTEANRRAELLDAAARLFVEKGFAATTTRDIAKAVGMRSGSPFYHFRSKQALLKAVILERLAASTARQEAALGEGSSPIDASERLRTLIHNHLDDLLAGGDQAALLVAEARALDEADRAQIASAFDRYQLPWQKALDELASAGLIASSAPPARLLLIGMLNWSSHWYRPDGPLSIAQLTASVLALILRE